MLSAIKPHARTQQVDAATVLASLAHDARTAPDAMMFDDVASFAYRVDRWPSASSTTRAFKTSADVIAARDIDASANGDDVHDVAAQMLLAKMTK
jgi:hypothetical protein